MIVEAMLFGIIFFSMGAICGWVITVLWELHISEIKFKEGMDRIKLKSELVSEVLSMIREMKENER
jgi:hypothetical protein